jgi:hypothetical protein
MSDSTSGRLSGCRCGGSTFSRFVQGSILPGGFGFKISDLALESAKTGFIRLGFGQVHGQVKQLTVQARGRIIVLCQCTQKKHQGIFAGSPILINQVTENQIYPSRDTVSSRNASFQGISHSCANTARKVSAVANSRQDTNVSRRGLSSP